MNPYSDNEIWCWAWYTCRLYEEWKPARFIAPGLVRFSGESAKKLPLHWIVRSQKKPNNPPKPIIISA